MGKPSLEDKKKKLLQTLKKLKKPVTAAEATKLSGLSKEETREAGKALMQDGKVRFADKAKTLIEFVPAEESEDEAPAKKPSGSKAKPKAKPDPEDEDDDDDWDDEDGDEDGDTDGDEDTSEDPENIEDLTTDIVKLSKKRNSIVIEHEDEEIELIADEEDIDVSEFEKGQSVTISAEWDSDEEEWTLTAIEDADSEDGDADADEDDDEDEPKPKAKAKAKEAKGKAKGKGRFSLSFKSLDQLSAKQLTERIEMGLEAAEDLAGQGADGKIVAELIMRTVPRLEKQLKKIED